LDFQITILLAFYPTVEMEKPGIICLLRYSVFTHCEVNQKPGFFKKPGFYKLPNAYFIMIENAIYQREPLSVIIYLKDHIFFVALIV
jgi:hypothetical protein